MANIPVTLNRHLELGTEIVRYGGRVDRLALFRRYLQGRRAWVIPLGGTCWTGVAGFVNAGLELAEQIAAGQLPEPDRLYVANGTMGTVAGLSIGLALRGLPTKIHAVRVAWNRFVRPVVLQRLMQKTVTLLHRLDPRFPLHTASGENIVWRGEFFAGGYARSDESTEQAVQVAKQQLGLSLETTYTGKAMAALLHDLDNEHCGRCLFWNSYNSSPPQTDSRIPTATDGLPPEFLRYYDDDR